jgi:hypothetical protein
MEKDFNFNNELSGKIALITGGTKQVQQLLSPQETNLKLKIAICILLLLI